MLGGLVRGDGVVRSPLVSDDTDAMLRALETFGVIIRHEGDVIRMDGGDGRFPGGGEVNLGAGGTPARFMIAAATLARLPVVVDGNARMRERPVAEGVEFLRTCGATITYVEEEGRLPVRVEPGDGLVGGTIEVGGTASSQFISALMLVAPWSRDGIEILFTEPPTSSTYLDLTARCMQSVGASVEVERTQGWIEAIRVAPGGVGTFDVMVESDASSAIYPAALAAMVPGSRVEIQGINEHSAQPDVAAIMALRESGAGVESHGDQLLVTGAETLRGLDLDCRGFPDAAVMLGALAAAAATPSRLTGLDTLRVKECDRVEALATELTRVGCRVESDWGELRIHPAKASTDRVTIQTYDDHRIAMAFAVLGAVRGGIDVQNPGCVAKSHPGFFDELAVLCGDSVEEKM